VGLETLYAVMGAQRGHAWKLHPLATNWNQFAHLATLPRQNLIWNLAGDSLMCVEPVNLSRETNIFMFSTEVELFSDQRPREPWWV
jgi:hypothetical protein